MKKDLQDYFFAFEEAYRLYRTDVIAQDALTSEAFNKPNVDGDDAFPYHDRVRRGKD